MEGRNLRAPYLRAPWKSILALALFVSPAGAQSTIDYEYDALGRLIKIEDPSDDAIGYVYDKAGNRIVVASGPIFSVADDASNEGDAVAFVVTRAGITNTATSVDYATSTGTAGSGDFTGISTTTLNFAIDETSKTINVSTTEDSTYEANETFTFTLSNAASGSSIGDATATGTITNDDGGPAFSVNDVSVSEGGNLSFTVTKTGSTSQSHNVSYATADASATAANDYTTKSGALTFTSSQTTKTVSIVTTEDTVYENDETMRLNLSNATGGATISDSQGNGYILNDDAQAVVVQNAAGVVQSGFTQIQSAYHTNHQDYLYRTKDDGTGTWLYFHHGNNGFCVTSVTLASGYSWTGNQCEIVKD